jgi:Flp pilus assembly protein TadG
MSPGRPTVGPLPACHPVSCPEWTGDATRRHGPNPHPDRTGNPQPASRPGGCLRPVENNKEAPTIMKPLLQLTLQHLSQRMQRKRERGAITVLVATLMGFGVLTGSAAMVVDVGGIYVERGQLQSGADAAAQIVARSCLSGGCDTTTGAANQVALAQTAASRNRKAGDTQITEVYKVCGTWGKLDPCTTTKSGTISTCVGARPGTGGDNYVEVWVRTKSTTTNETVLPPTLSRSLAGNGDYNGTSITMCARMTKTGFQNEACVKAADATYTHTFNGPLGTATIKPDHRLCPGESQDVTLVSYTAPDDNFALPQFVYDVSQQTIDSTTSTSTGLTFKVDVPACYTQVDFVFRTEPINPLADTNNLYNNLKIGSPNGLGSRSVGVNGWYNGGTATCAPKPSVTWNGTTCTNVSANLTNGSTANVDASFMITSGAGTQYVHVAKGASTKVTIAAADADGSGVTIQDNTFVTTTRVWSKPRGC